MRPWGDKESCAEKVKKLVEAFTRDDFPYFGSGSLETLDNLVVNASDALGQILVEFRS